MLIDAVIVAILHRSLGYALADWMTASLHLEYTLGYAFLVMTLYWPLLEASPMRGTFGKRLAGLRVATMDGEGLPVGRALLRHVARLLMVLGVPPLGYVMVLATRRRQAWDDLLSGSVTVHQGLTAQEVKIACQSDRGVSWPTFVVAHGLALAVLYVPARLLWDMDPGIELRRALEIYPADDPPVVGGGVEL